MDQFTDRDDGSVIPRGSCRHRDVWEKTRTRGLGLESRIHQIWPGPPWLAGLEGLTREDNTHGRLPSRRSWGLHERRFLLISGAHLGQQMQGRPEM